MIISGSSFIANVKAAFCIGKNWAVLITFVMSLIITKMMTKTLNAPFIGIDGILIFFKFLSILWLTAIPYIDYLNWLEEFKGVQGISARFKVVFRICLLFISFQLFFGLCSLFINDVRILILDNFIFGSITVATLSILSLTDYFILQKEGVEPDSRRAYYHAIFLYADLSVVFTLMVIFSSYIFFKYLYHEAFVPVSTSKAFIELETLKVSALNIKVLKYSLIDLFFEGASLFQSLISSILYIVITVKHDQWKK